MDRLKRTLSFRRKEKEESPWQEDERTVRLGLCRFHVKYLGCVEVPEPRGMHLCEQAIRSLLNVKKTDGLFPNKVKHQKVFLHISGDALRLTDGTNKALILDQTIDKVSFCAPDRDHRKAFAYICRDGTTRRWLCHGFLGREETGERLSHAVGCAFQICVEKRVRTDWNVENVSFARFGSFRATSLIEPIRSSSTGENLAIERPRPRGSALRPIDLNRLHSALVDRGDFNPIV